ncbi:MAG: hypothetical protein ABIJ56_10670 [Pseudomonadota bacterium]
MPEIKINPDDYFTFKFQEGKIAYTAGEESAFVIPAEALSEFANLLEREPSNVLYTLGLCVGRHFGRSLSAMYGDQGLDADASPEDFLNNINGILSLHGYGLVSLETWGDVLLFEWETVVDDRPLAVHFQEGVLCGILRVFTGRDFEVSAMGNFSKGPGKYCAGNYKMIQWVKELIKKGVVEGEIVSRLNRGEHLK